MAEGRPRQDHRP